MEASREKVRQGHPGRLLRRGSCSPPGRQSGGEVKGQEGRVFLEGQTTETQPSWSPLSVEKVGGVAGVFWRPLKAQQEIFLKLIIC